jgi:hypothetical protein
MPQLYRTPVFVCLLWLACLNAVFAQVTFFSQDFSQTRSFVNPSPDTGQFSHILLTSPELSYHKFYKGYMDLTRTQQDSATGGIIRAMRATPFFPNPETLLVRVQLSVEAMQNSAVNAVYFYVGEDFNPVNNSFPENRLMFGKCAVNFHGNSFTIKDLETRKLSKNIPLKTTATITWVLNNAVEEVSYQLSERDTVRYHVRAGSYDLWVNDELVSESSKGYPGNSSYSKTKLSNFEMRFRNGLGKIRIRNILIREAAADGEMSDAMILPNPSPASLIRLKVAGTPPSSLQLVDLNGRSIAFRKHFALGGIVEIRPEQYISPGIYVLSFVDKDNKKRFIRVMVY